VKAAYEFEDEVRAFLSMQISIMAMFRPVCLTVTLAAAMAACGSPSGAAGGAPGGGRGTPPPMPVEIVTLEPKPVEQVTEFVGTIKSRRSTNIQPQAEGFITRIAVTSGAQVRAGALLMEIDSRPQQASISSLESVKAQREIDVTYARQEAERARKLLEAGAASQMDADRAANALKAAEAQVRTVEEQIQQLRTDLAYYRVTAPTSGIVGDIPVRQGDRVTKSTLLTTVDANAGLEVYLNIPVQEALRLRVGLPVRLLDDKGAPLVVENINFVSPSVEDATQTVLAKVPLSSAGGFRTSQFVRAQVIWSTDPALTVPLTSVQRINGQFFAFVAEAGGEGGSGLVARQRAVTVGPMRGNDYVVVAGLNPGERLIVSGLQKIGDGSPVMAGPPGGAAPAAGRGGA
jgi:RND family efflux transporter MFP subunit